jgi:RimJ/RimL family protein N-acetyltransferase
MINEIPRKLSSLDRVLLYAHFLNLDSDDRRLRFGTAATDEYIKKYVDRAIEDKNSKWFGIEDDNALVAVCHAAIYENGEGELGCSVDTDYRNCGYAQALFDRAVTWLRSKDVTNVFMHCLSENGAMKHIAKKNRMTVITHIDETKAQVEFEPATPLTHVADAYLDRVALYDMVYRNTYRAFKNLFA